jgi:hypothetical protein
MDRRLVLVLFTAAFSTALGCGDGLKPLNPPMTMTLENKLQHSVFFELGACGVPGWVTVEGADGKAIELASAQGGSCSGYCDGPRTPCPEAAFACIAPQAMELPAGMNVSLTWDGIVGRLDSSAGCTERSTGSGSFTAVMCWGDAPSGTNRQNVTNPRCASVPFVVGRDLDVRGTAAE